MKMGKHQPATIFEYTVLDSKERYVREILYFSGLTAKHSELYSELVCLKGVTDGGIMKKSSSEHN